MDPSIPTTNTKKLSALTLKRISGDIKAFNKTNPEYFQIWQNPSNILEIYFLLIGREGTPYAKGHYIGCIIHHEEYPLKAPNFYVLTPNGRFKIKERICLTNSSHHQESWSPAAWNLVSMLEGFSSVWHSTIEEDLNGLSHIKSSREFIEQKAYESNVYNQKELNHIWSKFPMNNPLPK
jgi:ubiquitin-protein ligase